MISLQTKMTIGYKFTVETANGFKIMAGRGRQIVVTYKNDMFDVWAYTLRGTNLVKEVKIQDVFGGQSLQEAIVEAANG